MLYEKVFKELEKQKVRYLVIGGIAVNLHGFTRATADLDLFVALDEENLREFIKAAKTLGLRPRVPVSLDDLADAAKRKDWIQNKHMKVFTLNNPKDAREQIDMMVVTDIDFEKAYKNKTTVSVGAVQITIAGIKELIKLKEIAGRAKDKMDIEELKEIEKIKKEKKR